MREEEVGASAWAAFAEIVGAFYYVCVNANAQADVEERASQGRRGRDAVRHALPSLYYSNTLARCVIPRASYSNVFTNELGTMACKA